MTIRQLKRNEIVIRIKAEKEHKSPINAIRALGSYERKIRNIESEEQIERFLGKIQINQTLATGDWFWCSVVVTARLIHNNTNEPNLCGMDVLTCASFINKEDFIENSGVYNDMINFAIKDLQNDYQVILSK